jgi:nitrate reductase gamma subunit
MVSGAGKEWATMLPVAALAHGKFTACAESGSGAVIGAIIGILLGLALLAGLIALCCRRRQNKKRARKDAKAAYLDAQVLCFAFGRPCLQLLGLRLVFLK